MIADAAPATLGQPQLLQCYRQMLTIRVFDSRAYDLYRAGSIRGSSHSYHGMEAIAVGACAALRPDDYITSTHRGHGHCIAKGGDVARMMAELFGKATGYCKGKGGSMHIADVSAGNLGANGIVGGGIGIATGAALAASLRGDGQVALCFFGDGAINQGALYECANLAAIWRLPVIYICENNQYAASLPVSSATALDDLATRAVAFGFPGVTVDGMDVETVYAAVNQAVERARRGAGPTLVCATTYRLAGHFMADTEAYRARSEVREWWTREPIARLRARLLQQAGLESELSAIEQAVTEEIERAVAFAENSPEPEPGELHRDVYA